MLLSYQLRIDWADSCLLRCEKVEKRRDGSFICG